MPSERSAASGASTSACRGCGLIDTCAATAAGESGPLKGPSLVAAAVGYFCLPLALALGGAFVAGTEPLAQLIGGGAGLVLGISLTTRVVRRSCVRAREHAGS